MGTKRSPTGPCVGYAGGGHHGEVVGCATATVSVVCSVSTGFAKKLGGSGEKGPILSLCGLERGWC